MHDFFEYRALRTAKWYQLALVALTILAFLFIPINKILASNLLGAQLGCAFIGAIIFGLYHQKSIVVYLKQLSQAEKIMLVTSACFPLLLLPSIFLSDDIGRAWSTWGRYCYFLLCTPVYLAFKHNQATLKIALMTGMLLCAYGMGIRAIYSHYWLHIYRNFGDMNPITTGNICTVLVLALTIFAIYAKGIVRFLIIIGVIFALIACILSDTRGALLSLVTSPLIALFILVKNKHKILVIAAALLITLLAYLLLSNGYLTNLNRGINQALSFMKGDTSCSSWGVRIAMWQNAILIIKQSFFFGAGISDWYAASKALTIANGHMANCPIIWSDSAHSIYFQTLATSGTIGLLGFLSMFAGMFYLTLKSTAPFLTKLLSLNIIFAFMTTGVSETWTSKSMFVSFFMLTAFLILSFNYRQQNAQNS